MIICDICGKPAELVLPRPRDEGPFWKEEPLCEKGMHVVFCDYIPLEKHDENS